MPIDLSAKRIPITALIPLKNADGSPMADPATGDVAQVRVHSPASKLWEQANARVRRNAAKRVRENGGKIEAAAEGSTEDTVEFLCAITEEFIGVTVKLAEGEEPSAKAIAKAIYSDPQLGFIRDQVEAAARDWGSFLEASPTD